MVLVGCCSHNKLLDSMLRDEIHNSLFNAFHCSMYYPYLHLNLNDIVPKINQKIQSVILKGFFFFFLRFLNHQSQKLEVNYYNPSCTISNEMTGHNNPWYALGKKNIMSSIQEIVFLLNNKNKKGNTTRSISCRNIAKRGHKKLYPYLAADKEVAIQGL